jgi:membrane protease YdiL (CAAX protease family)
MFRPWLSLLAFVFVVVLVRTFWSLDLPALWSLGASAWLDGVQKVVIWVLPCLAFLMLAGRQSLRRAWREAGLGSPALGGVAFGLVATVPMALALPLVRSGGPDLDSMLGTVLLGPVAEEVLFRGFLLAFLVRRAGWSVPVAIYVTSLAFGLAHMDRTLLSVLLVSAGGALFGWVYYRWGNLWHAIGLHACINLWWELTSGRAVFATTSADTFPLSVAHALSIGLAILLTVKGTREERESAAATI